MINLIREVLQQYINEIDSGNSNISEKEQMKLIDVFREINRKELSALEACDYIGVCKSTFYNYIEDEEELANLNGNLNMRSYKIVRKLERSRF